MHLPVNAFLVFCLASVIALAIILPMEWRRIKRLHADPEKTKRRPGELSSER